MRRDICRNEQNARELAALASGLGQRDVPAMNRIESASEKPDIHERLVSAFCHSFGKLMSVDDTRNWRYLKPNNPSTTVKMITAITIKVTMTNCRSRFTANA